jgi:hypothetical protein
MSFEALTFQERIGRLKPVPGEHFGLPHAAKEGERVVGAEEACQLTSIGAVPDVQAVNPCLENEVRLGVHNRH